jgi:hypothetical protein
MGRLPFDVALERSELLIPMRLLLIQPSLQSDQALRTKVKYAQPGVFQAPLVRNHAGVEQHSQMAAHGGGGQTGGLRQLPGAHWPVAEELDNMATRWVAQGAEQSVDIRCHVDNS